MRIIILALALTAAACTPAPAPDAKSNDAPAGSAGAIEAPDPERDAMLAVLNPRVGDAIGIPVAVSVTTKRTQGEWGWIVGQPWTPDGAQIDWSQTHYAQRAADGVLDGNGATYALLHRENGAWTVVDMAVGPTDVAWADWAPRYGAPAALFVTE